MLHSWYSYKYYPGLYLEVGSDICRKTRRLIFPPALNSNGWNQVIIFHVIICVVHSCIKLCPQLLSQLPSPLWKHVFLMIDIRIFWGVQYLTQPRPLLTSHASKCRHLKENSLKGKRRIWIIYKWISNRV